MDTMQLPPDYKEFLKRLRSAGVEFLVVGGYAVGYHGYPRTTADIDIWIAVNPQTTEQMIQVLNEFGYGPAGPFREVLLKKDQVLRMGLPPVRIEILTGISGRTFSDCYARKVMAVIDGEQIPLIGLDDLKANKRAAGRHKDLDDLEHLP